MSYTPTEWKTGDVVTSAKLNKLEQGVADAGGGGIDALVVTFTATVDDQTGKITGVSSNKTVSEIVSAVESGKFVVATIDANRWGMSDIVWLFHDSGLFTQIPAVDAEGVWQTCVEYGTDEGTGTDYFNYFVNEYPGSNG